MNNRKSHKDSWPDGEMEQVKKCPVCQSVNRNQLYEGLSDNVFFCAPGVWNMYKCNHCKAAYLDPRPTPESIHLAYRSYYTHDIALRPTVETMSLRNRTRRSSAKLDRRKSTLNKHPRTAVVGYCIWMSKRGDSVPANRKDQKLMFAKAHAMCSEHPVRSRGRTCPQRW